MTWTLRSWPSRLTVTVTVSPGLAAARAWDSAVVSVVCAPATAVIVNMTVTNTTANGHLIVYPSDASQPIASDLNWAPGQTVPNLVVVKLSADGKIAIYNGFGSTDVIVDVLGYIT